MREKVHGWPDNVYAPSAVRYNDKLPQPKEMSKGDVEDYKNAWVAAVKRALVCKFDVIEIHNAQYAARVRGDGYGMLTCS